MEQSISRYDMRVCVNFTVRRPGLCRRRRPPITAPAFDGFFSFHLFTSFLLVLYSFALVFACSIWPRDHWRLFCREHIPFSAWQTIRDDFLANDRPSRFWKRFYFAVSFFFSLRYFQFYIPDRSSHVKTNTNSNGKFVNCDILRSSMEIDLQVSLLRRYILHLIGTRRWLYNHLDY